MRSSRKVTFSRIGVTCLGGISMPFHLPLPCYDRPSTLYKKVLSYCKDTIDIEF